MKGEVLVLCNGAQGSNGDRDSASKILELDYRDAPGRPRNAKISIPKFTDALLHLPPRVLDLLEIASYVFTADRYIPRGSRDQVTFSGWSRRFKFVFQVSDECFWTQPAVKAKLEELLTFISGDETFEFCFEPGFSRQASNLFDRDDYTELIEVQKAEIALFSGGLDSTTGAVELLESSSGPVCLVSHKSGLNSTTRTQGQIVESLRTLYPKRVRHIPFECNMAGLTRAPEETQRTRFFLYGSIAFAVARACGADHFMVYENGITSINFRKRQDLVNARASRTTHPKTIRLLSEFFELVLGSAFEVRNPYLWNTKADILVALSKSPAKGVYSSTVSCSRSIKKQSPTHCGTCSQCVDRRFAAYGAGLGELDDVGTYAFDFVSQPILGEAAEARTIVNDYLYMAKVFEESSEDYFQCGERLTEVSEVFEGVRPDSEETFIADIHSLCTRFGKQVWAGYEAMRTQYGRPSGDRDEQSLYSMVERGDPFKEPAELLAEGLQTSLSDELRIAFHSSKPANEQQLNDQIEALLKASRAKFEREYPSIPFATRHSRPDHASERCDVLIEAKYIRRTRSVRAIIDEMAADLVNYGSESLILFLVYDPQSQIRSDITFRNDFTARGKCQVCIVR